jgi:serine kinase of HPr protein (carbohydrate metabolism regulator)
VDVLKAREILHATLIARRTGGAWRGVLLRGPSGAGKSSLALRAMSAGFRLVADDRVIVWRSGAAVFGRAPETLAGLLEVRGVGVVASSAPLRMCQIALLADLVGSQDDVERVPERRIEALFRVDLPCMDLFPFDAAAPEALIVALAAVQRSL